MLGPRYNSDRNISNFVEVLPNIRSSICYEQYKERAFHYTSELHIAAVVGSKSCSNNVRCDVQLPFLATILTKSMINQFSAVQIAAIKNLTGKSNPLARIPCQPVRFAFPVLELHGNYNVALLNICILN